jgi:hypothetical protein
VIKIVLVTLVVVIILGLFGWLKFRRDEKVVIEFLKNSGVDAGDDFKSTAAISSATRLSESRIRRICGRSARVRRHHEDWESWKLHSRESEE